MCSMLTLLEDAPPVSRTSGAEGSGDRVRWRGGVLTLTFSGLLTLRGLALL